MAEIIDPYSPYTHETYPYPRLTVPMPTSDTELTSPPDAVVEFNPSQVDEQIVKSVSVPDGRIHDLLDNKHDSHETKTTNLIDYIFEQFDLATERRFELPDRSTIADKLLPTATFLHQINIGKGDSGFSYVTKQASGSDDRITVESNFDIILEEIKPYRSRTPVALADQVFKKFPLKKEARLAKLATIIWLAEIPDLGLDNLARQIHEIAHKNTAGKSAVRPNRATHF